MFPGSGGSVRSLSWGWPEMAGVPVVLVVARNGSIAIHITVSCDYS